MRYPLTHIKMKIHMLRIVLFVGLSCALSAAFAQPLSLATAIEQAIQNRAELKVQQIEVELASGQHQKIKAQWRPQISGSADLRWNTQLQTSVLPIGAFGLPNTPADATTEIQLGLPFTNTLGIQAEQKVYDPLRALDYQLADAQVLRERTELEQQTTQIRYAVTEAYYSALYAREQLTLAQAKVAQRELDLAAAQTQLRAGSALPQEVDRFALDLNNARFTLRKAEQNYQLGLEQLYYLMGADAPQDLQLSESLAGLLTDTLRKVEDRIANRPELRLEQIEQTISSLNQQRELRRMRPSVTAYANYTLLQLNDNPNPFEAGTWFPFNYVGIKATVPIYDGRQARLEAQDYSLRQQTAVLRHQRLAADFDYQARTERKAVAQARLDLIESEQNITLARQIFATDRLRYEQGVIRQSDLMNTEISLKTAEENYLSAVYNLLLSHLNYQKAMGF